MKILEYYPAEHTLDVPEIVYQEGIIYLRHQCAYQPATAAQVLLKQIILQPDSIQNEMFIRNMKYLKKKIKSGRLYFEFDYLKMKQNAPWISGIGQAFAASLFARHYYYSKDKKSQKTAIQLIDVMLGSSTAGGCLSETDKGPFIEEYPGGPAVLNGYLISILAVYDVIVFCGEKKYRRNFQALTNAAKLIIDDFIFRNWSYYSLYPNRTSNFYYHSLHRILVATLGKITKEKAFQKIQMRWRSEFPDVVVICKALMDKFFRLLK